MVSAKKATLWCCLSVLGFLLLAFSGSYWLIWAFTVCLRESAYLVSASAYEIALIWAVTCAFCLEGFVSAYLIGLSLLGS